jgi:hypothetical protein
MYLKRNLAICFKKSEKVCNAGRVAVIIFFLLSLRELQRFVCPWSQSARRPGRHQRRKSIRVTDEVLGRRPRVRGLAQVVGGQSQTACSRDQGRTLRDLSEQTASNLASYWGDVESVWTGSVDQSHPDPPGCLWGWLSLRAKPCKHSHFSRMLCACNPVFRRALKSLGRTFWSCWVIVLLLRSLGRSLGLAQQLCLSRTQPAPSYLLNI